ncbi:glutathione S-transferase family protein [Vibrio sp.]|uniref:glutathione S-transferase family protein n=1 Tax=Vibrio sp. TaxID=678 RepID=UPI003D1097D4
MIQLYGVARSRALRVSWLLEELGLDWQFNFIDFAKGEHRSGEFLAMNPSGKVPVIRDGEVVLSESSAIMYYLAEKYGNDQWMPAPGSPESAQLHFWVSFTITELEQPLWTMGKHKFALPADKRLAEIRPIAAWEFAQAAAVASKRLPATPFLTGDTITIADLLLAHTLNWATMFEQPLPENLAAFRDRISSRPTLKAALDKSLAASS